MPPTADPPADVPTMPRWIDYIPLDDLVPDPRNPKRHDEGGLDASLERFQYTEPVMLDERTGMLVAGHGRRDLVVRSRDEGKDPPDGIVVDAEGRWLIPVSRGWSSKNDDEAYAYLIASNRWVEKGGWDDDLLVQGLKALEATEAGLDGVGYVSDDVNLLLAQMAKRNPTAPSEFPEFGENISTEHQCPRCGYQWSGQA